MVPDTPSTGLPPPGTPHAATAGPLASNGQATMLPHQGFSSTSPSSSNLPTAAGSPAAIFQKQQLNHDLEATSAPAAAAADPPAGSRLRPSAATPRDDGPLTFHPSRPVLNLEVTLPHMQYRKKIRQLNGTYAKEDPYRRLVTIIAIVALWSFHSVYFGLEIEDSYSGYSFGAAFSISYQTFRNWAPLFYANIIINILLYLLFLWVLYRMARHLNRYNTLALKVLTLAVTSLFVAALIERSRDPSPSNGVLQQDLVMLVFLSFTAFHMLIVWLSRNLVPYLVRRDSWLVRCATGGWRELYDQGTVQGLIRLPAEYTPTRPLIACYFQYSTPWYLAFLPLWTPESITYVGEMDPATGRPCGYGEWRDTHWHGEHLTGFWHAGVPTGPFRSRETGSASGFVNLRIAYFRNRREEMHKAACIPRPSPLQFGIVSCEVSTSGAWYKSLPDLKQLIPPVEIAEGLLGEEEAEAALHAGLAGLAGQAAAAAGAAAGAAAAVATAAAGAAAAGAKRAADLAAEAAGKAAEVAAEAARAGEKAVAALAGRRPAPGGRPNGGAAPAVGEERSSSNGAGSAGYDRLSPPHSGLGLRSLMLPSYYMQQAPLELHLHGTGWGASECAAPTAAAAASSAAMGITSPAVASPMSRTSASSRSAWLPGFKGSTWDARANPLGRGSRGQGGAGTATTAALRKRVLGGYGGLRSFAAPGLLAVQEGAKRRSMVEPGSPGSQRATLRRAASDQLSVAGSVPVPLHGAAATAPDHHRDGAARMQGAAGTLREGRQPHQASSGQLGEGSGSQAGRVAGPYSDAGPAVDGLWGAGGGPDAGDGSEHGKDTALQPASAAEQAAAAAVAHAAGVRTPGAAARPGPAAAAELSVPSLEVLLPEDGSAAQAAKPAGPPVLQPIVTAAGPQHPGAPPVTATIPASGTPAATGSPVNRASRPSTATSAATSPGHQHAAATPNTGSPALAPARPPPAPPLRNHVPRLVSMLMPLHPAPTVLMSRPQHGLLPCGTNIGTSFHSTHGLARPEGLSRGASLARPASRLPVPVEAGDEREQGVWTDGTGDDGAEGHQATRAAPVQHGGGRAIAPMLSPIGACSVQLPYDGDVDNGPVKHRQLLSFIRSTLPYAAAAEGRSVPPSAQGDAKMAAAAEAAVAAAAARLDPHTASYHNAWQQQQQQHHHQQQQPPHVQQEQEPVQSVPHGRGQEQGQEQEQHRRQRQGQGAQAAAPSGAAGAGAGLGRRASGTVPRPLPAPLPAHHLAARPHEAFLFVHGLGVDMHRALRHYAQMMALVAFPPYISPVLFSWPSSNPLGYFQARYRAAESPDTARALAAAVQSLAADGYAGLHLLVHSMGSRVLMNALPLLEDILAPSPETPGAAAGDVGGAAAGEAGGPPRMRLLSVTLMNPDFGLKRFVEEAAPRLRALSPLVTVYGDTADGALGLSEVVNALARPFVHAGSAAHAALSEAGAALPTAASAVVARAASAAGAVHRTVHAVRDGVRGVAAGQADSGARGVSHVWTGVGRGAGGTAGGGAGLQRRQLGRQAVPDEEEGGADAGGQVGGLERGNMAGGCTGATAVAEALERDVDGRGQGPGGADGPSVVELAEVVIDIQEVQAPPLPPQQEQQQGVPALAATASMSSPDAASPEQDRPSPFSFAPAHAALATQASPKHPHHTQPGSLSHATTQASLPPVPSSGTPPGPRRPLLLHSGSTHSQHLAAATSLPYSNLPRRAAIGHEPPPPPPPPGGTSRRRVRLRRIRATDAAAWRPPPLQSSPQPHVDGGGDGVGPLAAAAVAAAAGWTRQSDLGWWRDRVLHFRRRLQQPLMYSRLEHSLGRRIYELEDPASGHPLDVDVVDISYLSSNVNTLRHTHFALNREVLDDLWELVVLGRRAAVRTSRLEPITGNVYGMAVAPSYLSSRQI